MNQVVFDYVAAKEAKVYEISLDEVRDREVRPIFVEVIEYSGNPDIEFALNEQFTESQKVSRANASWMRF